MADEGGELVAAAVVSTEGHVPEEGRELVATAVVSAEGQIAGESQVEAADVMAITATIASAGPMVLRIVRIVASSCRSLDVLRRGALGTVRVSSERSAVRMVQGSGDCCPNRWVPGATGGRRSNASFVGLHRGALDAPCECRHWAEQLRWKGGAARLERCAYRVVTDWRRVRVELVAEGRWVDVHPVASSQAGIATSRPRRRAFRQIRQRRAARPLAAVCACRAFRDHQLLYLSASHRALILGALAMRLDIAAPREIVFAAAAAPYADRQPRAMREKVESSQRTRRPVVRGLSRRWRSRWGLVGGPGSRPEGDQAVVRWMRLSSRSHQMLYVSLRGPGGSGGEFDGFSIHPADADGTLWRRPGLPVSALPTARCTG